MRVIAIASLLCVMSCGRRGEAPTRGQDAAAAEQGPDAFWCSASACEFTLAECQQANADTTPCVRVTPYCFKAFDEKGQWVLVCSATEADCERDRADPKGSSAHLLRATPCHLVRRALDGTEQPRPAPPDTRRWCAGHRCASGLAACNRLRAESPEALPPCELPIAYCFAVEEGPARCFDTPNSCNVMRAEMVKYPKPGIGKPITGCDRVDTAKVPERP